MNRAFSLLELLTAIAVFAVLTVVTVQLLSSIHKIAESGHRRMDADEQTLALFNRMAIDFAQMIQRADVDYFLKNKNQPGNDQMAFYSQTPGYHKGSASRSPFSVVGYRVNANNQLQRFGCGLMWSGYNSDMPETARLFLPQTIAKNWPAATTLAADPDHYELAGPQIFRFEYYYVLKGRTLHNGAVLPSILSDQPWDARSGVEHNTPHGLRDIAAIGVVIAVIDVKTQLLVSPAEMARLAGSLSDFDPARDADPGSLEAVWRQEMQKSGLPAKVLSAVHIYRRWFYLNPFSN